MLSRIPQTFFTELFMVDLINRINLYFSEVPEKVIANRKKIWIGFLLLTILLAIGISKIKTEMAMESFFEKDEPIKEAYNRFKSYFGSDEVLYIVYKAKDGDVFSSRSLLALKQLQERLILLSYQTSSDKEKTLHHIEEVTTLINAGYLEPGKDQLVSRDFIGNSIPDKKDGIEKLRKLAKKHPVYPLLYFSVDDQYGGLLVKTDFNAELLEGESFQGPEDHLGQKQPTFKSTELKEYNRFMKAVNQVLKEKEFSDHFEFYPIGNPVLMGFAFETMEREMGMLFGGLLLLIILVLWIIFRSFSAVVWPVTLVVSTLVWVMGLNGWVGIPVSNMNEIIVFLVLAVGIADSIHILSGYLFYRNQMFDHLSAMRQVYQKSGLACLLTSVTTSVGLIVLIFVPIVPIRNFAVFAALGVLLVFLLTIVLLPLMLDLWNPVSKKRALSIKNSAGKIHVLQKLLQRFEILNHKRPATIIAIFIVSGITLLYGATKIKVDTNQIESIDQETLIRKSYDLVDLKMGGTGNMEIMIDTGIDNGFKNPDLLKAIENLQENLIGRFGDKVVRTQSIVDVVKDSFQAINEGDETKRIIPTDPMVLGQTMFLFENVDPEERSKWISENYQVGRVGINARNMGSLEGKLFMERVQGLIQENIEPIKKDFPDLKLTLTGQIPLMNKLSNFISHSQLKSFAITMVVISVMLLFVFGSFRIGLIAILPNLMPMIAIFGVMGFLDIGLDMHLMLVAPITIGIAVDDTIHFLTHYRLEFEKTKKVGMSIQRAFREAGQAILFTSLVLSVGFFIFIFSTNRGFEYFGIFSGLAIVIALLADLFFLPSIITLLFKPKAAQKR